MIKFKTILLLSSFFLSPLTFADTVTETREERKARLSNQVDGLSDIYGFDADELTGVRVYDKNVTVDVEEKNLSDDELSACGAFMCLFDLGSSECKKYLTPYLSIEAFTNLNFDPRKTFDLRETFLLLCPAAEPSKVRQVNTSARGSLVGSGVFAIDGTELTYWQVWLLENHYDLDIEP